MAKRFREDWEWAYCLYVDGKPTKIQLLGSNKTDAYTRLPQEWQLYFPNTPLPKRYRCKLQPIDGTFQGYK